MAEGRTKTGVGWETTQHGFKAINYAQTAADVLNQAAEGTLVATGLGGGPDTHPVNLQPWSVRQAYWGDNQGLRESAMSQEEGLFRRPPDSYPEGGTGAAGGIHLQSDNIYPEVEGTDLLRVQGGESIGEARERTGLTEGLMTKGEEVADFLKGASMGPPRGGGADVMTEQVTEEVSAPTGAPTAGGVEPPPGFEDLKQEARAGAQVAPAETWGPGPTEAVMDRQTVPAAETWGPGPTGPPPGFTGVGERHPPIAQAEGAFEAGEAAGFLDQLALEVKELVERMKGYSLSPEEFAELTTMSPEQLTEVYNNLARQQGRPIHPSPHAWNLMGREPFQSPESAAIFQGRVPMSEEVIRPGESEYSQWNIPPRMTGPGFMAQDYAQAQPGTTDWMRQIYPWARNLPENVLQRAIQDGEYLRMLMQKAEAGELLPLM